MKHKVTAVIVRSDWMKACGYAELDTRMDVTFVYPNLLPDLTRIFEVVMPNGREWTVAEWRCREVITEGGAA